MAPLVVYERVTTGFDVMKLTIFVPHSNEDDPYVVVF